MSSNVFSLRCPLQEKFDNIDDKFKVLYQQFSELVDLVHHHKKEAEIIKQLANSAQHSAMLAHDITVSARHIARDSREIFVDESDDGEGFPTMRELVANQRENVARRIAVVGEPTTVREELIDEEEKFSPETLVELEAEEIEGGGDEDENEYEDEEGDDDVIYVEPVPKISDEQDENGTGQ